MFASLRGIIDRRILVNFRIAPEVLSDWLPEPFEPQTVAGNAIGGICLIRLRDLRPTGIPRRIGFTSENQAHQFAVKWRENGDERTGVYIPHRHTDSLINRLCGGRLFPGSHYHGTFDIDESRTQYKLTMQSTETRVQVAGEPADSLPVDSMFESVADASAFVEKDVVGYSPNERRGEFEALELRTDEWNVTPFSVTEVSSNYLDRIPDDITFDHALLMSDIDHEWHDGEASCSGCSELSVAM